MEEVVLWHGGQNESVEEVNDPFHLANVYLAAIFYYNNQDGSVL